MIRISKAYWAGKISFGRKETDLSTLKCVIVTGLSGAGKTEAARALEDMGFFCIDNFPALLLDRLEDMILGRSDRQMNLALIIDARGEDFFGQNLGPKLDEYIASKLIVDVVFIEASDEVLIRRYKESRRPHPLLNSGGITEALKKERNLLSGIRARATKIIDTSDFTPRQLRMTINELFCEKKGGPQILVTVTSFGFKNGIPLDSDLVFDVRFLPNPYYESHLRNLTGENIEVRKYVFGNVQATKFMKKYLDFIKFMIPQYIKEGRTSINISIGCTGGKHRSVAIASKTVEYVRELDYKAHLIHRDIAIVDKLTDIDVK